MSTHLHFTHLLNSLHHEFQIPFAQFPRCLFDKHNHLLFYIMILLHVIFGLALLSCVNSAILTLGNRKSTLPRLAKLRDLPSRFTHASKTLLKCPVCKPLSKMLRRKPQLESGLAGKTTTIFALLSIVASMVSVAAAGSCKYHYLSLLRHATVACFIFTVPMI